MQRRTPLLMGFLTKPIKFPGNTSLIIPGPSTDPEIERIVTGMAMTAPTPPSATPGGTSWAA